MTVSVAHVLRTYGVSGGERQLAQLFAAERGSAYQNTFYSLYDNPTCTAYFSRIDGLRQKTVLFLRASVFPSLAVELVLLAVLAPVLQLRVLYLLGAGRHRICVAHGLQAAVACWLSACVLRNVHFVYIHRGTKSRAGSHPVFKWLYWPFEIIAGVSIASAESLKPLARKRKVIALENGIDLERLREVASGCAKRRSDEPLRLISSARLIKDKEHAFLLDVFAQLLRRWPDLEFVIAGDGPEHQNLTEYAQQLGIAGKVHFIGHVTDIICRMANSDIFVHASRMEGMSNSVLEAMALGLPSVVVDAPGVSECHRDGETGFIVTRSANEMAAKLALLIDDGNARSAMGEKARQRAQDQYSIAANLARYQSLYRELLGN